MVLTLFPCFRKVFLFFLCFVSDDAVGVGENVSPWVSEGAYEGDAEGFCCLYRQ